MIARNAIGYRLCQPAAGFSAYPNNRSFDTRCALLRMRLFGILRYSDRLSA